MVVVSKVVLERALKDGKEFAAVLAELNTRLKFAQLSFLRPSTPPPPPPSKSLFKS